MRALIVIDVQRMYDGGGLSIVHPPLTTSLPNITRAMTAATAAGIPVVVVAQVPSGLSLADTAGTEWEQHPALAGQVVDHLVTKSLPSAFQDTDLAAWLATNEVRTLTLTGYMTHNCVDSTARDAMHRGYTVEVLADATGTPHYANAAGSVSAETLHTATLTALHARFAAVAGTEAWLDAIATGAPLPMGDVRSSARAGAAAHRQSTPTADRPLTPA